MKQEMTTLDRPISELYEFSNYESEGCTATESKLNQSA